ncbi:OmpA family protein [Pleionea sp. CnH1-48]|uniref:flagellar protein MotY n=1 Tax=Pleionea sp. CnH1-48 TaxID=2954494 RepID=UPI002097A80C|nr:OmpA family protein [Pleionea sp. CnH1-48]MCO7227200.1 OmpA family protein [Pleionea sp. CnH1-48]
MKSLIYSLLLGCLCISSSRADFRAYEAEVDESVWDYSGNPVRCELKHKIPLFGEAIFYSSAGRLPNMTFILDGSRNRVATDKPIHIRSLAPDWLPGKRGNEIGKVMTLPGEKTLNIFDDVAWKLLIALESGRIPTFFYRDLLDNSDQVSVALSNIQFRNVYTDFLQCVDDLLPYGFREIEYSLVHFRFNSSRLGDDAKKKLDWLAAYLKYDERYDSVVIEGHTDSIAFRRYNKALGLKRAKMVREYLVKQGVDRSKVRVISRGERRPLESNATEEGRALNRRVFITVRDSS